MALEIELKLSVAVEDLARLRPLLPSPMAVKDLRNVYYDTPDRSLEASKRMLRLRLVRGRAGGILCFKGPSVHCDGVFRAEELEWPLSSEEAAAFAENPGAQKVRLGPLFPELDPGALASFGEIRVQRTVYRLADGLDLEMDLVGYSDGSGDAELEVEVSLERVDEARGLLDRLLQRAGVHATAQEQTKYQRFLARA